MAKAGQATPGLASLGLVCGQAMPSLSKFGQTGGPFQASPDQAKPEEAVPDLERTLKKLCKDLLDLGKDNAINDKVKYIPGHIITPKILQWSPFDIKQYDDTLRLFMASRGPIS